ncbi:MAG: DNA-3-methyladenine glycosylase [Cellvibrio sp.]
MSSALREYLTSQSAWEIAPRLLGAELLVRGVGGIITEVEAYDQSEAASHTFKGPNLRNQSMFKAAGIIYVYRSYGIHWCMNIVCGKAGHGAGVLIRALEPRFGIEQMKARRKTENINLLCKGPGCVGQALGITQSDDGLVIDDQVVSLKLSKHQLAFVSGPRIGISKAMDLPWRFGLAESSFWSRKFG